MLSKHDVFIIRSRKGDETEIALIHRQTGLRVETHSASWDQIPEFMQIQSALEHLSEKVAAWYAEPKEAA